jgi:hypothetical protein
VPGVQDRRVSQQLPRVLGGWFGENAVRRPLLDDTSPVENYHIRGHFLYQGQVCG